MWTQILAYRDFWDVPRAFVAREGRRIILVDCAMAADGQDFSEWYDVWELAEGTDVPPSGSWEDIRALAVRSLGRVLVDRVKFDATRRRRAYIPGLEAPWTKITPLGRLRLTAARAHVLESSEEDWLERIAHLESLIRAPIPALPQLVAAYADYADRSARLRRAHWVWAEARLAEREPRSASEALGAWGGSVDHDNGVLSQWVELTVALQEALVDLGQPAAAAIEQHLADPTLTSDAREALEITLAAAGGRR
jgi:hypothetical protein